MKSTSERVARLSPQKLALLKKAMGESRESAEPIAIIGMGCRFAGANSVDDYWHLICDAIDATGEVPSSRWDVDAFFDASGKTPGKMTTRWGGFLDNIDQFDAAFFGISPREAEKMDPQHRILLQVAWEALEYGGLSADRLRGSSSGVFVGIGGVDYSRVPIQLDNYYQQITAYSGTGNALSIAANRISYTFDLRGPSMAIDTACSSSLVAAHLAVRSLRSNECDLAIAGGVNAILSPETTLAFSQAQMLSLEGTCRPFDDRANGYVRGEGCGVVILKRLSDAVSSGDMILATIRGSAINQDGLTSGITAPRGTAQVDVIRKALRDAHCSPSDVSYIEAHGTGTPLGDPIELQSLAEVFRSQDSSERNPCYVGSVKANIGHTETAAGAASLIKTILMLRHKTIPKQTHFQKLNRHIDFGGSRLMIAQDQTPWETATARAGISSFGFGGTNAHLVLEAASMDAPTQQHPDRPRHIFALSAKSPERLRTLAGQVGQWVAEHPDCPVADACHTAIVGRSHLNHRLAVPTAESSHLQTMLEQFAAESTSSTIKVGKTKGRQRLNVAFLFAGQGSQFVGMGHQLYQTQPAFRAALDSCDEILRDRLPSGLLDVLFNDHSESPRLHQTLYTQPALFAVEYALSRMWRSFGIEPTVMIGHSIGDYVGACEAGVFSLEDALILVTQRAKLVQELPPDGMMAVIFAGRDRVADLIDPYQEEVAIAAHNGPQNVVISGRDGAVGDLLDQFESAGIKTRPLEVSHAFHSPLLDPILDEFEACAAGLSYQPPKTPLISGYHGQLIGDRICEPGYWRDHLRHTVNFASGVAVLQTFSLDAALEVAPGTALCSMASRACRDDEIAWLPSLRPGRQDWDVVTNSLSELYVRGANVNWVEFDKPWNRRRLSLPTYPFDTQSHWYDMSRRTTVHRGTAASVGGGHPLVGSQLAVAGDKTVFEAVLSPQSPAFLADHCVDRRPVFPAAAYLEQATVVADQLFGESNHAVKHLSIQQPMVLTSESQRVVQVQIGPEARGERSFEVHSRPEPGNDQETVAWTLHAYGTLHKATPESARNPIDRRLIESRMQDGVGRQELYDLMAGSGLNYGPMFQIISNLRTGTKECLAQLQCDQRLLAELPKYHLHPSVLDGCLQSIAGVVYDAANPVLDLVLPTFVEQVRVFRRLSDEQTLWAHTRLKQVHHQTDSFEADIDLFDGNGLQIAEIVGVRVQRVSRQHRAQQETDPSQWLYQLHWQRKPLESTPACADRQWIVLADAGGVAEELTTSLVNAENSVVVVQRGSEFRELKRDREETVAGYEIRPHNLSDYQELVRRLTDDSAVNWSIVDFWPLGDDASLSEGELANSICHHALLMLQAFATSSHMRVNRLAFVSRGANRIDDADQVSPAQASLWGFSRTAMVEMPDLSCRLIDLDPANSTASPLSGVLDELIFGDGDGEDHVGFRGGDRFVARLEAVPGQLHDSSRPGRQRIPPANRFSLRVGSTTGIEGLSYVPIDPLPPQANEVEIEIKSTGLNFSDVLKSLGLYPGITDQIVPLGIECAGIVSAVGQDVDRFQVGQRVMGVAPYSFASHTTTAEYALVATPDHLSDDQAATIPITFLTAYYGLCSLAHLAERERVLIHAGAGGVGLAAIQIAQSIGAEVFATAGSDQKRDYLRQQGVQHVMDSRTLDFADRILEITSGGGVDVVLNSLPGDAITASLSVLSAYGRFLEIGKTDIYQNRRIGLWPFQDNLSYFAIDLDRMLRQRPDAIRQLYRELMPHFEQRTYAPLPVKTFKTEEVVDAFRYMSQRKNIGKVVVSMAGRETPAAGSAAEVRSFSGDGTVLITGGLGALGLQVARWIAEQGGKHVALLARRAPDAAAASRLEELEQSGVAVAVLRGDVCDQASLSAALKTLPETFPPIRGVVHAAGVLSDGLLHTMDGEQLNRSMDPKTKGAWNLHCAITEPVEFFVLFSSVAATLGAPGQANYAAGNAFLDGLACLRKSLGLPATSIAWGPWDQAGMAATADVRRQLTERGMSPLAPGAALSLLDQAIRTDTTNIAIMDVDWKRLLAKLTRGGSSLLASFRGDGFEQEQAQRHQRGRDEELCRRLEASSPPQRIAQLETFISGALADVMGVDSESIDPEQPLAALGLDSLMGMELRSNLEAKLGVEIPTASFFDDPSVHSLAKVSGELLESTSSPDAAADTQESDAPETRVRDVRRRSALVRLGGAHGGPPVFCVHPVGGDLRCYAGFARALQDRTVFGLRASGLQAGSKAHQSIDQMVDQYARSIQDESPDGPYCLMGWSTGGIFAYEIARRFREDGRPVQALIMIDTPLPVVFENVDLDDKAKFLVDLVEFANYFAGTTMEISYEALHQLSEEQAISTVLSLAIEHGVLPTKTTHDYLRRLIDVCRQHVSNLQSYQPPACEMQVDLLRPIDTDVLSAATRQSHADDLGWGRLVTLRSHWVPGHHFTMMTGPNAAALADKVEALLRASAENPAAIAPEAMGTRLSSNS